MKQAAGSLAGLDHFRLIAAFLVVAIHTSPLSSVNGTADYILSGVIARIAVPFFFMVSGFFLFSERESGKLRTDRLSKFLKRTGVLYALSILLYLPLNIYSGKIDEWRKLSNLLKDVLFDGTFYHLWYLPAAMAGAAVAWLLLRKLKPGRALGIGLFLYVIALSGDSYYGLADKVPGLSALYKNLFVFSDYTRNGVLFAPVFFILGAMLTGRSRLRSLKGCLTGLAISVALLVTEGLLLRGLGVQRHDSMYLMLLPCLVFLFQVLLHWKGGDTKALRTITMLIYIIHPLMLVLVRGLAGITGLRRLLIDNSVFLFIVVAGASYAAAMMISLFLRALRAGRSTAGRPRMDRAWAEIDLSNLGHNIRALRGALPGGCELMAVVKSNAYGHGDVGIAGHLNRMGVKAFAVAAVEEGIRLRKRGIKGQILVLGRTSPSRAAELVRYRLSQAVADHEHAEGLMAGGKAVQVHIGVDTGMHRLGEDCGHVDGIAELLLCGRLKVRGIFTHLSASRGTNVTDIAFTREQIGKFRRLLDRLTEMGIEPPPTHVQGSYGALNYPEIRCDYARIGLALYGVLSSPEDKAGLSIDLRPVLALRSRVTMVRKVSAGEIVGYDRQFIARRETNIAVLPIGYADGVPRDLSCGRGRVLIRGCRAPIIGWICMNQLMVDVTDVPAAGLGDVATLIGRDGPEEISAEQMAAEAGTITNELLSRLSDGLERVFLCP